MGRDWKRAERQIRYRASPSPDNDCLLGCIIFVALSFAGNTTQRISLGWFNLLVP